MNRIIQQLSESKYYLMAALSLSILAAVLISKLGVMGAGLVAAPIVGIPIVYGVVAHPKFGIIVLILACHVVMWVIRMDVIHFPLGTLMDALEMLLILGFFIKQKQHPDWWFTKKNAISVMVLVWVIYNVAQVGNPTASSRMAWLYTIRSMAAVTLLYYVFCYVIDDIKYIRLLLKLWIGLSAFAALYAFKQEFIGFTDYELASVSSEIQMSLMFIDGHWRKFSIFSDPVAFSYNMVITTIICLVLIIGKRSITQKVILGVLIVIMLYAMLFSGTRGAYVLLPAAMVFFGLLHFNRKVLILGVVGAFLFVVFINMPSGNPSIRRFQSAFAPSEDASFNLRKQNQKKIQPYILAHPLGGGLGATGGWGMRFSPGSYLSSFPPDSGYVRTAVELGSIGLLIFCALMFVVLKTGIDNFFTIRDPELKSYALAMLLVIFALGIGNYPQEAFVQFPNNILFYLSIAIIVVLKRLDDNKQKETLLVDKPQI